MKRRNALCVDARFRVAVRGPLEQARKLPEFHEPRGFRLRIPMSVMGRSGEKLETENAGDIPIGSWGSFEMSSSDAVTTFEDTIYPFLQHKKDGAWNALLGGRELEYGLGGLIDMGIDGIGTAVDWRFPDGCEWIPGSLYKNC